MYGHKLGHATATAHTHRRIQTPVWWNRLLGGNGFAKFTEEAFGMESRHLERCVHSLWNASFPCSPTHKYTYTHTRAQTHTHTCTHTHNHPHTHTHRVFLDYGLKGACVFYLFRLSVTVVWRYPLVTLCAFKKDPAMLMILDSVNMYKMSTCIHLYSFRQYYCIINTTASVPWL